MNNSNLTTILILALKRNKHRIKETIFELHINFYHTSCLPVIPFPFPLLEGVGYACRLQLNHRFSNPYLWLCDLGKVTEHI